MLCFLCGKKIGLLRSLADQQYCCAAHRKEARLASAQALRDEDDIEPWAVSKSKKKAAKQGASAGQTASIFAFMAVAALLVAAVMLPGPGAAGTAFPPVSLDPGVKRGLFQRIGDSIGDTVRSRAPVTLHQDFQSGWGGWSSGTAAIFPHHIDDPRRPNVDRRVDVRLRLRFCASGAGLRRCRTTRWNSAARSKRRA